MAGVKGRSGRKPLPSTIIERTLQRAKDKDLPEIIAVLIQKAKDGDKDCAIYVCDRLLGRPKQEIDARMKAQVVTITPDEYELATRIALAEQQRLLAQPGDVEP